MTQLVLIQLGYYLFNNKNIKKDKEKRFLPEFNWEQKNGEGGINNIRQKAKMENRRREHFIS